MKRAGMAEERAERPMERRLSPQGRRTLMGFKQRYGEEAGEQKFYRAIESGTLSAKSMWAGNTKSTGPEARAMGGGVHSFSDRSPAMQQGGLGSDTYPGLRTFSRNQRPTGGGAGLRGQAKESAPGQVAHPGQAPGNDGMGGPRNSTATVGRGKPIAKGQSMNPAAHGNLGGLRYLSREEGDSPQRPYPRPSQSGPAGTPKRVGAPSVYLEQTPGTGAGRRRPAAANNTAIETDQGFMGPRSVYLNPQGGGR